MNSGSKSQRFASIVPKPQRFTSIYIKFVPKSQRFAKLRIASHRVRTEIATIQCGPKSQRFVANRIASHSRIETATNQYCSHRLRIKIASISIDSHRFASTSDRNNKDSHPVRTEIETIHNESHRFLPFSV